MDTFEYKTVIFEAGQSISTFASSMENELNNLGKDGWELVSLITNPQLGNSKYVLVGIAINTTTVFKRKQG